jgi:hypothetical protein
LAETTPLFTIESFYKFVKEGKLMGAKCNKCGQVIVPPKPMCPNCLSKDLRWMELPKRGKLLTYTVIHVSPKQFQSMAPYVVGIVEFEEGAQLPGMVKNVKLDAVKVGMNVTVDFDKETVSDEWPQWSRYHFKPLADSSKP